MKPKNFKIGMVLQGSSKEIAPDLTRAFKRAMKDCCVDNVQVWKLVQNWIIDRYPDVDADRQLDLVSEHYLKLTTAYMTWETYCLGVSLLGYHRVSVGAFVPNMV